MEAVANTVGADGAGDGAHDVRCRVATVRCDIVGGAQTIDKDIH